jgi:hypothetical protein
MKRIETEKSWWSGEAAGIGHESDFVQVKFIK